MTIHYPAIIPNFTPKQVNPGARHIKCTITEDAYGAMHWAARRSGTGSRRSVTLAEFMQGAILDAIARVARDTVAKGGELPQNVAAVIQGRRRVGN